MYKKYFSTTDLNTGRQEEFDVARAFSVVGMVFTHVFLSSGYGYSTGLEFIVVAVLGTFLGAPLFMFYMGAAINYSTHNSPAELFKRGIIIFIMAYLLNIVRLIGPDLIIYHHYRIPFNMDYFLGLLLRLDILQFAGLAFITMAIFKKFNVKPIAIIIFSLALSIIATFKSGMVIPGTIAPRIVGLFIGARGEKGITGFFSYSNYFIFVGFGYVFGIYWRKIKDKKAFFKKFSPICAVLGIIGLALELYFKVGLVGTQKLENYYFISLPDVILSFLCAMAMAGVYYWLYNVSGDRLKNVCIFLSKNIFIIYVVHLIVIRYTVYLIFRHILMVEFTNLMLYGFSIIIIFISYYITKLLRKTILKN